MNDYRMTCGIFLARKQPLPNSTHYVTGNENYHHNWKWHVLRLAYCWQDLFMLGTPSGCTVDKIFINSQHCRTYTCRIIMARWRFQNAAQWNCSFTLLSVPVNKNILESIEPEYTTMVKSQWIIKPNLRKLQLIKSFSVNPHKLANLVFRKWKHCPSPRFLVKARTQQCMGWNHVISTVLSIALERNKFGHYHIINTRYKTKKLEH